MTDAEAARLEPSACAPSRARRAIPLLVFSALLAAALLYRPGWPGFTICGAKLAGFSCPGCGMVRSVSAFAQGRFDDSLGYHLFGPLVFAVIVALWGAALYAFLCGLDLRTPNSPLFNAVLTLALILLVGYWLARVATGTVP